MYFYVLKIYKHKLYMHADIVIQYIEYTRIILCTYSIVNCRTMETDFIETLLFYGYKYLLAIL